MINDRCLAFMRQDEFAAEDESPDGKQRIEEFKGSKEFTVEMKCQLLEQENNELKAQLARSEKENQELR